MLTVRSIITQIGSDAIQARVNVGEHSVRAAKTTGVFPANWYRGMRDLCAEQGLDCPMDLFNWKDSGPDAPLSEASRSTGSSRLRQSHGSDLDSAQGGDNRKRGFNENITNAAGGVK